MRCYTRFDLKQPNIASLLFTFVGLHEIRKRNSRDSTVVFCDLLRLIIRAFHSLFNKLIFNTNNCQLFFLYDVTQMYTLLSKEEHVRNRVI